MHLFLRRAAALSLAFAAAGCAADVSPTAPVAPSAASSHDLLGLGGLTSGVVNALVPVTGLQRTTPLAQAITVTQNVGTLGGVIAIPQAGVSVVVPYGALKSTTTITMTARAGSLVAYDFAPDGIVFQKPLVFTQSLAGTNATALNALTMQLGYYDDASLLTATGGLVSQLLSGTVNLLTWTFTSNIPHFSGYLVTWGCIDG
jgi:hypothetical protein